MQRTDHAALVDRHARAFGSVQVVHCPPPRASPASHDVQSEEVGPEQVLQLVSQTERTPPTKLKPVSAVLQTIVPVVVTEQALHPMGHCTASPVDVTAALTSGELRA